MATKQDDWYGNAPLERAEAERLRAWLKREGDVGLAKITRISRMALCRAGSELPLQRSVRMALRTALESEGKAA